MLTPILPFSPIGLIVLSVFIIGLAVIVFKVQVTMDKSKPSITMLAVTKKSLFEMIAFIWHVESEFRR